MRYIHSLMLACLLFSSSPGFATTVLQHDFASLVQEAETVVVGTVTTVHAEWDVEQQVPYTFVTFTDLEVQKGSGFSDTLTLQFLGGPNPDGMVMHIAGVPTFHPGDRLLLFIAGNTQHTIPLVGLWQGVYRVVLDPEQNTEVVYTHTMQPLTTLPRSRGSIVHDHMAQRLETDTQNPLTLDTVLDAIRREMRHD